jgi:hypothetical protein
LRSHKYLICCHVNFYFNFSILLIHVENLPSSLDNGSGQTRFTLLEKENIVAIAYLQPGKRKATARRYAVQPKDIQYWAKTLQAARYVLSPIEVVDKIKEQAFPQPGKASQQSIMKVMMPCMSSCRICGSRNLR